MATVDKVYSCDFEIFGKVQGVFFRKFTQKQAKELGLHGWCMNTTDGSVKGQLEGSENSIRQMQHWLQYTGSPQSRISKATFSELKEISEYTMKSFTIRR